MNKLAENGTFQSTRTAFCGLTQMVPIDLILDAFARLKLTLDGDESSNALGALRDATDTRSSAAISALSGL